MKKKLIIGMAVALVMSISVVALVGCGPKITDPVANQITNATEESFAFAVKRGNVDMLTKLNDFFALESTTAAIDVSMAYHSGSSETTIEYPDLSDNTGVQIKMITEAGFAPYEYVKNTGAGSVNGVAGLDVDLMIMFAEKYNYTLKVENGTFAAVIPTVDKDNLSIAAAGMTVTDERKEKVDFATPYVKSIQYIISSKSTGNYKTIAELKGLEVGVQTGATGHLMMKDAVGKTDKGVEGELYGTKTVINNTEKIMNVYQDFLNGNIDAIIIDKFVALNLIKG